MTSTPLKYERQWWHYVPPAYGLVCLGLATTLAAFEVWSVVVLLTLVTGAFAFQTWWIWIHMPRKWPYEQR